MLDALHHVLLIEAHGTFTAAARQAALSQPALTASIKRLESDLGARLFHRGPGAGGRARLTAAGQALLPHARAALAAVASARRAVAEVAGLATGEVRLAAGATACTYLLPPLLAQFTARWPGIRLVVTESTTRRIHAALAAGAIDLGVVTGPGQERWRGDALILVAGPDGPFAALSTPEAIGRAPVVAFAEGSPLRTLSDQLLPESPVVMALTNIAAVKGNVRAGVGIALVSEAAVGHDLATGRLVALPHPATPMPRQLSLVHHGEARLPPAAAALRSLLLDHPAVE